MAIISTSSISTPKEKMSGMNGTRDAKIILGYNEGYGNSWYNGDICKRLRNAVDGCNICAGC